MKKIIISLFALGLVAGITGSAFAAKFTNPAGGTAATTILSGSTFQPSTNVGVDAIATVTQYSVSGKHEAGGTNEYGTTETATDFTATGDLAADDTVTDQTTAGTLVTP